MIIHEWVKWLFFLLVYVYHNRTCFLYWPLESFTIFNLHLIWLAAGLSSYLTIVTFDLVWSGSGRSSWWISRPGRNRRHSSHIPSHPKIGLRRIDPGPNFGPLAGHNVDMMIVKTDRRYNRSVWWFRSAKHIQTSFGRHFFLSRKSKRIRAGTI